MNQTCCCVYLADRSQEQYSCVTFLSFATEVVNLHHWQTVSGSNELSVVAASSANEIKTPSSTRYVCGRPCRRLSSSDSCGGAGCHHLHDLFLLAAAPRSGHVRPVLHCRQFTLQIRVLGKKNSLIFLISPSLFRHPLVSLCGDVLHLCRSLLNLLLSFTLATDIIGTTASTSSKMTFRLSPCAAKFTVGLPSCFNLVPGAFST